MCDNVTMDNFLEPLTPEEQAKRRAMAEIKDEVGRLRTKLRSQIRTLRRRSNDSLVPSEQASLDQQIAAKQKEFDEAECIFLNASTDAERATQNHYKQVIGWDAIMRKHGVAGY